MTRLFALACANAPTAESDPTAAPAPVLVPPPEGAPLSWRIYANSAVPTAATLEIVNEDGHRVVQFLAQTTAHALPLLGLPPDSVATVRLTLADDADAVLLRHEWSVQSPPLEGWWPEVQLDIAEPDRMEPGWTLVPLASDSLDGWIAALGSDGRPRWLIGPTPTHTALSWRPDRATVFGVRFTAGTTVEMDRFGAELMSWGGAQSGPVQALDDVSHLHHEVLPLPEGGFATLDMLPTIAAEYAGSYDDKSIRQTDVLVSRQQIVEVDGAGAVVRTLPFEPLLDPIRVGYGSLEMRTHGLDWIHANAIALDEAADQYVVSSRNQDALFAIDRASGELAWIVAPQVNWLGPARDHVLTPTGSNWLQPSHQHAPHLTPDGTWLVVDNGNVRASPFTSEILDPDPHTEIIELAIDPEAGTVERLNTWEPADGPIFSSAMGSVVHLPTTGGRLIDYGFVERLDGVDNLDLGRAPVSIRLVEQDADGEVVWDLSIFVPATDPAGDGTFAYRAHRIPSLYGPEATETWL